MVLLCSCTPGFESEPLVEYSTEVVVTGSRPHALARQLENGIYLVEVRERDIDLRVAIDSGTEHRELVDSYLRHGVHRSVVRLYGPTRLRVRLDSIDVRSWKGAAAVRILRWPRGAPDAPADQRLLGFEALGRAEELIARGTTQDWRASLEPMREAARLFQAAEDWQSLAEAEYLRSHVEYALLFDFESGRHSAQSALAHFQVADDDAGAQRASMLLALHEFAIAARMDPAVPRMDQRSLLDAAARRVALAQQYFESHDMQSDALAAIFVARNRENLLGHIEDGAVAYEALRQRARARGDRYFEAVAAQGLGRIALRKGQAARAEALYEGVLPAIERARKPILHAMLLGDLGDAQTALGEFDRALASHGEALEIFTERGDDGRTARELTSLAAIQFRSGNVERALSTVQSALPLHERSRDQAAFASALRLAGNSAAELGRHDLAVEYLRAAERRDRNGITSDRTRVLLAGEMRTRGDVVGATRLLARVLATRDEATRADALAERARLHQAQKHPADALADLRAADAIYARLKLDFNRIDSCSALSLALLDSGDIAGASAAADTAVALEQGIRGKAGNPEMRARFLAASYAPYEARIEVELAAAPGDPDAVWRAFRTAEAIRASALTDRLTRGVRAAATRRDGEVERLRQAVTSLMADLERRTLTSDVPDEEMLEARLRIDETRARLDALLLSRDHVETAKPADVTASRAALQAALPADTAALAYFVGDHRSHAWLVTRDSLRHIVLPGRRELESRVAEFNERQRSGAKPGGGDLSPTLLGNLLDGLAARRLLVLPDGPLNGLPFAALGMPGSRQHELLVDRFVITAAPSLALALRPPAPHGSAVTRVAVISDPVYTADDRRLSAAGGNGPRYRGVEAESDRLARLPYSAIEARAVARAFAGAEIIELTGFDANARRVIELPAQGLSVLHFATHAVAHREAPEQSALFLSEYAADGSRLAADRLTSEDIRRSGLSADIVVLSGCATGDGRELRGEGVLGLTYGFLANGSSTVVASLWPVEDALTAQFMQEFYAAYRVTGRAGDALRTAQLRARGAGGPAVWSSFVVRASALP